MQHNRLLLVFALTLAVAGPAQAQPAPVRIDVIVSQTGSFANVGARIVAALGVLQGLVNAGGGINGQPLQLAYGDDQTNPVIAVQLANAVIARGAPILLGPISAASCAAVLPLVAASGPVDYCFSPVTNGPPGGYVFSIGAGTFANNVVMVRFFHAKGWKRLAIIGSTDASCRDVESFVDRALQEPDMRDMQVVAREHFAPSDLSIAAQAARLKAAAPQAVITCASGTIFGTVLHGLHDAGLDLPTAASSANMIAPQLVSYAGIVSRELYFTATRGFVPDPGLGSGPVKDRQNQYFTALRAAHVAPEFETSIIWDQTLIVVDALRHLGPHPTATAIRDYIENLHSWAGIAGIYDFRDRSQRGIGENALQIYAWDPGRSNFIVESGPAGRLR